MEKKDSKIIEIKRSSYSAIEALIKKVREYKHGITIFTENEIQTLKDDINYYNEEWTKTLYQALSSIVQSSQPKAVIYQLKQKSKQVWNHFFIMSFLLAMFIVCIVHLDMVTVPYFGIFDINAGIVLGLIVIATSIFVFIIAKLFTALYRQVKQVFNEREIQTDFVQYLQDFFCSQAEKLKMLIEKGVDLFEFLDKHHQERKLLAEALALLVSKAVDGRGISRLQMSRNGITGILYGEIWNNLINNIFMRNENPNGLNILVSFCIDSETAQKLSSGNYDTVVCLISPHGEIGLKKDNKIDRVIPVTALLYGSAFHRKLLSNLSSIEGKYVRQDLIIT